MELAVNMPAHEPQPGQAQRSSASSSLADMAPWLTCPTASNMDTRSARPLFPASMGPPDTRMAGIFSRNMAMSMAGTDLSQLAMHTRASKGWAVAMISTLSAVISRLGSE